MMERDREVERDGWCPLNMMMTCRFAASAGFLSPIPYIYATISMNKNIATFVVFFSFFNLPFARLPALFLSDAVAGICTSIFLCSQNLEAQWLLACCCAHAHRVRVPCSLPDYCVR